MLKNADEKEQYPLAVYISCMLFIRVHFRNRYKNDAEQNADPRKMFEAKLKLAVCDDLMKSFKECFENMGGRKDLVI